MFSLLRFNPTDVCYAQGQSAAEATNEAHADPVLAVFSKRAFIMALRDDANYGFMKNNPVTR